MAEINDWNVAAGSNTSTPPDGWPENMDPSDVNNTAREGMAVMARWHKTINCSTDTTGSANAYILAAPQTLTAYYDGLMIGFTANFGNTGAATVNVDSLGAKTIKKHHDQDLASGDIESGQMVYAIYDGTNFQMMSQAGNAPGTLSNVVEDTTPQLGGNLDVNSNGITFAGATVTDITGADTLLVSGTAGTNTYVPQWNADGDLVDGYAFLDEDTMSSDSATAVASQQSIKAYVDASGGGFTVGTEFATTSGSAVGFTSIPAGTKKIELFFDAVTTDGSANLLIQIGDSGGYETTGYTASSTTSTATTTATTGFNVRINASGQVFSGSMSLLHSGSNKWISAHSGDRSGGVIGGGGRKTLSAELDRIQVTTTDSFTAGAVNIIYS